MKLTESDVRLLRGALSACRVASIDHAAIYGSTIRSLSESRNAVILSELKLSIDPEIKLGIMRLSELEKRLSLFGDEVQIEGELTAEKKVRKLLIRAKTGKIEFRCTDINLLERKYPKANNDEPASVVVLGKAEVGLLAKGVRTLGAEQLNLQLKRDGLIRFESLDSSNDRFELELEQRAEFVDEPYSFVLPYHTGTNGALLPMLEASIREAESVQLIMMKSGSISLTVNGHTMLAIPRIQ